MTKPNNNFVYSTRATPFHLVLVIIFVEAVLGGLYLFAKYGLEFLNSVFSLSLSTIQISTLLFFVFSVLQIGLLLYVVLGWLTTVYEVSMKEVVYKSGVFNKRARAYDISNIQSTYIEQTFLGRIFDFGKVTLYSPALKEDLYFAEIPEPKKFKSAVDSVLYSLDSENNTYLRRFS